MILKQNYLCTFESPHGISHANFTLPHSPPIVRVHGYIFPLWGFVLFSYVSHKGKHVSYFFSLATLRVTLKFIPNRCGREKGSLEFYLSLLNN